jgi:hypothetical protein
MTSSAMCSDGAWLNGLSKLVRTSNSAPATPVACGRSKVNRSGNRMKQVTATIWAVSSRRAWLSSSALLVQTSKDKP